MELSKPTGLFTRLDGGRWVLLALPFLVLTCSTIFWITEGNIVVALVPVFAPFAAWGVLRLPMRTHVLALLAVCLFVDSAGEVPHEARWRNPLWPLSRLLYENLSNVTGIGPLRFPLIDALVIGLLALVAWRRMSGSRIDPPGRPLARPLVHLLLLSVVAVVVWDGWGTLRGGDVNESLWQVRGLLLLPVLGLLFLSGLRGDPSDYRLIVRIVVGAAIWKSLVGTYFLYTKMFPFGLYPEYATIHSDTLTYVWVLTLLVAMLFEKFDRATILQVAFPALIVTWGMMKNDRRLAYVSLGATLIMVFLVTTGSRLKTLVKQAALLSLPLVVLYGWIGWQSQSRAFFGAQLVKSLIKGDQAQTGADYRDIEIWDVINTWDQLPLTGQGWGHPFVEPVKLPDISGAMPTYQFHPHNSWLWIWANMGFLGVSALWAYAAAMVYLAARSYRFSTRRDDRLASLMVIATVIAHLNQCFGDIGIRSYNSIFLMGLAAGVVGTLSVRVGAWSPAKPRAVTADASQAT